MAKGGKICLVLDGKRKDKIAMVSNTQEPAILAAKKVHAFFFTPELQPLLDNGRHENGIISADKLKVTGFYD